MQATKKITQSLAASPLERAGVPAEVSTQAGGLPAIALAKVGEAFTLSLPLIFFVLCTFQVHAQIRNSTHQNPKASSDTSLLKKTQIKAVNEAKSTTRSTKTSVTGAAKSQASTYENTLSPERNEKELKSVVTKRKDSIKEKVSSGDQSVTFSNTDELKDGLKKNTNGFYKSEVDGAGKDLDTWKKGFTPLNSNSALEKLPGVSEMGIPKDMNDLKMASYRNQVSKLKNELPAVKKVYSEKTLRKIYDSLGLTKADSLARVVYSVSKKQVSEKEMLEAINKSFPEYGPNNSLKDTAAMTSLGKGNYDPLYKELPARPDLSTLKLSDSLMHQLPDIDPRQLDSKYLTALDSLRRLQLRAQKLTMSEQKITENIKAAIIKEKPRFIDKSYFEGIVGYVKNGQVTVFQASPSLGYHFTKSLSVGLGPNVAISVDEKKLHAKAGFRSFIKSEVWKQRAYLQVEDNVSPMEVNTDNIKTATHKILTGGGILFPLSKSVALNMSVLYNVNKIHASHSSPWVFRIGISSIGNKKK